MLARLAGLLAAGLLAAGPAPASDFTLSASTPVGTTGDSVRGAVVQSDGTIVVAANVSAGPFAEKAAELAPGKGVVVRLSADGTRLLSATRVAGEVRDLAADGENNLYVAAGKDGAIKLDPAASKVLWKKDVGGLCGRIDVGSDGTAAALTLGKDDVSAPGSGTVTVFDASGMEVGKFPGHRNTLDVCVDGASKTVVLIGWRQANANDGKKKEPVQIAYLRGTGYDGKEKYTLYDWPVDPTAPGFINKPTNNMADTRGYRCSIGEDGKVYCAFECAGANHIFRYEPKLADEKWVDAGKKKGKGDQYHGIHISRTFLAKYNPATGTYLQGQEFCAPINRIGKANAARVKDGAVAGVKDGAVAGDSAGRIYAGGPAASASLLTFTPPNSGDYPGGAYVLALAPGFDGRDFCTRIDTGGETNALAVRDRGGKRVLVVAGRCGKKPEEFPAVNPVQPKAEPQAGFVAVFVEK